MFKYYSYIGLIVCLCTEQTIAAKLPKSWKTCKLSDPNMTSCLKGAIEDAVHDLVSGNPSLGIIPLDPLHFDKIDINQGTGPVSINLELSKLDVTGIKNLKIKSISKFDWKDVELVAYITGPLVFDGQYKVDGKVMVLPVKGDGPCRIVVDGFVANVKGKVIKKEKNGKQYYEIKVFDIPFTLDKAQFQFDNLFNGDKALGNQVNTFINENWKEVLDELKPAIMYAFSAAFKSIGNNLFSRVQISDISPP